MTFYQLAFRYLLRKKSKTILLLLVLLFINSMILSTIMVLRATNDAKSAIQEKTNASIVLEITNENAQITVNEIDQITQLNEVVSVNRLARHPAFQSNFIPVTKSDSGAEDNQTVSLRSYDDLKNDSAFYEEIYRLISGDFIIETTTNSVVIHSYLADYNGLKIGDTMEFATGDGTKTSAKIIGLFTSGSGIEEKQTDSTSSVNRIENQIFIDNTTYSKLFKNDGYYKTVVYTKKPELLSNLELRLEEILGDKVEMTTSDTLYKQTEISLEQNSRVAKLMLMLTFITGIAVVTLLLCMWMRTRKKETAIFISIGKKKHIIFLQVLFESLLVFMVSVFGACGLARGCTIFLQSVLFPDTSEMTLSVFLKYKDAVYLIGLGGLVVLIAVTCSLIPALKAKPKETLSKMEG